MPAVASTEIDWSAPISLLEKVSVVLLDGSGHACRTTPLVDLGGQVFEGVVGGRGDDRRSEVAGDLQCCVGSNEAVGPGVGELGLLADDRWSTRTFRVDRQP